MTGARSYRSGRTFEGWREGWFRGDSVYISWFWRRKRHILSVEMSISLHAQHHMIWLASLAFLPCLWPPLLTSLTSSFPRYIFIPEVYYPFLPLTDVHGKGPHTCMLVSYIAGRGTSFLWFLRRIYLISTCLCWSSFPLPQCNRHIQTRRIPCSLYRGCIQ